MEQKWRDRMFQNYGWLALWYSLGMVTKEEAKIELKQYAINDREYAEAI